MTLLARLVFQPKYASEITVPGSAEERVLLLLLYIYVYLFIYIGTLNICIHKGSSKQLDQLKTFLDSHECAPHQRLFYQKYLSQKKKKEKNVFNIYIKY